MSPVDLISRHLADPQSSWAIGTFGAIAEFHRDADEPVALSTHGAVTARGGIRMQFDLAVKPIAWERPSAGDSWMHGIALCLPVHTHVVPDLLRHRRTHSANVPLPEGVVPTVEIFPANAIYDEHGKRVPFDATRYESFQALLAVHGDPACSRAKSETIAAVRTSQPPRDVPTYSRAQRLARRVALRQFAQTDGPSPALAAGRESFDREAGH